MLQQTQTHRVVPKYEAFLKTLPTIQSLAKAPLAQVLKLWQGLGYNRRALMLHRAAQVSAISNLPTTYEELLALPGIGPYTAAAVMVFAHNQPRVMIETNIRAALIHEFFDRALVHDRELIVILEKAVPKENPREFYQALMDYGAFLKQKYPNPSRRSAHHTKQSKFEGSDRQIRGEIVRALSQVSKMNEKILLKKLSGEPTRQKKILEKLVVEGLVVRSGRALFLPS